MVHRDRVVLGEHGNERNMIGLLAHVESVYQS